MPASLSQMTSSVPGRLALFGAALVALFAAGIAAGRVLDPGAPGAAASAEGMSGHGGSGDGGHGGATGHEAGEGMTAVRGLGVAAHGLRLEILDRELPLNVSRPLRFRIVGERDRPVRRYDVVHAKRMHMIVVRRDLSGFQHLHPRLGPDGTWAAPVRLDEPGSYRVLADFSHEGEATTLAGDVAVDGDAELRPLPAPSASAVSDGGYEVRLLRGAVRAGGETELRFAVARDGRPVAVRPYLGASGHLVALRDGDLAFLHVHPDDDSLTFAATFPTAGSYRLFLQFKVGGRVETAAFTEEVER